MLKMFKKSTISVFTNKDFAIINGILLVNEFYADHLSLKVDLAFKGKNFIYLF